MNKRIGFTLVELLVVISIIALLLAVLMPSLRRTQGQAKNVLCRNNLKQWGSMFNLYANDNGGRFFPGYGTAPDGYSMDWWAGAEMWMRKLRPYYGGKTGAKSGSDRIRLCPKATTFTSTLPDWTLNTTPFTAWGIDGEGGVPVRFDEPGLFGSYGINDWLHNRPPVRNNPTADREYWRTIMNLKSPASTVPMFADSVWEGTNPIYSDTPSSKPGWSPNRSGMWNFCIPRHGAAINVVFLDLTARKVPIKELWDLKWSPNFRTGARISWPAWANKDWGN